MRNMSRFKLLALTGVLLILILTTLSLHVTSEPQEQLATGGKSTISISAKGVAVKKTDEGWKKMGLDITLTLKLGERRKNLILIESVEGEITIDEISYDVTESRGAVLFNRNAIVLRLSCNGGPMVLMLRISYFWMGGSLYAVRGSGASSAGEGKTIILFRGVARVS